MAESPKPTFPSMAIRGETADHYIVEREGSCLPTRLPKAACPKHLVDAWISGQADIVDDRDYTRALLNELEITYTGPSTRPHFAISKSHIANSYSLVPKPPKWGFPTDHPELFGYPRPIPPFLPRNRDRNREARSTDKDTTASPLAPALTTANSATERSAEAEPEYPWSLAHSRLHTPSSGWDSRRPAPFEPLRAQAWGQKAQAVVGCAPGSSGLSETLGMGWTKAEMEEFAAPVREAKERERKAELEGSKIWRWTDPWDEWFERSGGLEDGDGGGTGPDEDVDEEPDWEDSGWGWVVAEAGGNETEGEDGSVGFEVVE
ncbi:hypothetical protein BU16DRAFT_210195 [Lophium mytilinum]|uniref:Uncharacterized protein n=1 Tax=Lophium mytilinum TaxID=390894 RepID=A0A6A6REC7_9PEZI|nr:hypothetical protein BU16DRAFT_210195 [Lophium mytilinum]